MTKPKVSMWVFVAAGVFCLIGGATGFSDLFIWAVASFIFAVMSWRGTKEREKAELDKQQRYRADVERGRACDNEQLGPTTFVCEGAWGVMSTQLGGRATGRTETYDLSSELDRALEEMLAGDIAEES